MLDGTGFGLDGAHRARAGHDVNYLGWAGVLEGNSFPLTLEETKGILPRGGTILGSSRTNPFKIDGGVDSRLGLG